MDTYDDNDMEEVENTEAQLDEEASASGAAAGAAAGSNRNFLVALSVLGGIFLLLIIGLVALFLLRRPSGVESANIQLTNQAIFIANTQTAGAATQVAVQMLTPSITPIPSNTPVPPTPTRTLVVALATATPEITEVVNGAGTNGGGTAVSGASGLVTATGPASAQIGATGTVPAALTLASGQTSTVAVKLTATAGGGMPASGFAEDVGLPGLFGMAIGLVLVIVLVRRLRFSTTG